MTDWLERIPTHRRVILLFWFLNAMLVMALFAFALRNWLWAA